ncbi:MAG: YciI family protein [Solirubrobacteraceae bacterium]
MADENTYLLLYTYVEDMADRRGPYRDAHLERIRAEREAGRITLAGALGAPPTGGAIVWTGVTPEVIERFTAADPYVVNGLVTAQRIERWNLI